MDKSPDWNTTWSQINFNTLIPLDQGLFSQLIDMSIPVIDRGSKTAIEIGCFPGRFIEYIGRKGYVINGVDNYFRVGEIAHWTKKLGHTVGLFHNNTLVDFIHKTKDTYDVVMSLGFIEHFNNFCEVLYHHLQLCAIGGKVVIGSPNFASPMQRALHTVLDKSNLESHVLSSMYPTVWATFLTALGVRIEYAGPVGGFAFWSDSHNENLKVQELQNLVPQLTSTIRRLSLPFNNRESSYVATFGTKIKPLPSYDEVIDLSRHCLSLSHELSDRDNRLSQSYVRFIKELCDVIH